MAASSGAAALPATVRYRLPGSPPYTVAVADVGLACCAVELVAGLADGAQPEPDADGGAGATDVLVISGTLTDRMAPAVRALYQRMRPRHVISFGSCANTGGPYWDSYSVTKGVDQLVPVDLYVPGCPPRPDALRAAVARLAELAGAG